MQQAWRLNALASDLGCVNNSFAYLGYGPPTCAIIHRFEGSPAALIEARTG